MSLFTMYALYALAVIAFLFGFLIIFLPTQLKKINNLSKRSVVDVEKGIFRHRLIIGTITIIFAIFILYVVFTIQLKL